MEMICIEHESSDYQIIELIIKIIIELNNRFLN